MSDEIKINGNDSTAPPRVSIVMAAYNPGPYLEETVRSVIAQSFTDWELIIVDDGGSQDISAAAKMDPKIVYVRQTNKGQSVARNVAILRARGEYIAFLDQDDLWSPGKLQQQIAVMDANPDAGMSYTNFQRIDGNGNRIGAGFDGGAETYNELVTGCCVCISTTMVRRPALASAGLFDPFYVGLQDFDMWLKIARRHKLKYVPNVLGSYRQHDTNLSHKYAKLFDEIHWLYREQIKLAESRGDAESLRCAKQGLKRSRFIYGSQAFDQGRVALRHRQWKAVARHLYHASRLVPWYVIKSIVTYPFAHADPTPPNDTLPQNIKASYR